MPQQVNQTDRPEQGYVSLSQYLNANRGTLNQQLGQAQADTNLAAAWPSNVEDVAADQEYQFHANHTPAPTADTVGAVGSKFNHWGGLSQAMQGAQDLGAAFGSQTGLAASGREGTAGTGESAFNSALDWAQNGTAYQGLSSYLGNYGPSALQPAINKGIAEGDARWSSEMAQPGQSTRKLPAPAAGTPAAGSSPSNKLPGTGSGPWYKPPQTSGWGWMAPVPPKKSPFGGG